MDLPKELRVVAVMVLALEVDMDRPMVTSTHMIIIMRAGMQEVVVPVVVPAREMDRVRDMEVLLDRALHLQECHS